MELIFDRMERLVGTEALERLASAKVILFGCGGVGSWCAEALVRSGVRSLTLVDADVICASNVNRQLQALPDSIGLPKVEALAERLRAVNPGAQVRALKAIYSVETRGQFGLEMYDVVIDAIDSYTDKLDLIEHACAAKVRLFSSMGAACRLDPTAVRTGSVWEATMCPFAKIVRKGLRRRGFKGDFQVVYSLEPALPVQDLPEPEEAPGVARKLVTNGSAVMVTAAFGMALASLVVREMGTKSGGQI